MLTGQDASLQLNDIVDLLQRQVADRQRGPVADADARNAPPSRRSASQRGSVVVLDVETGEIVAMYSNPTFDPNGLSVHDPAGGADHVRPVQRGPTTRPAPRLPGPLPAGFDVQDRDRQVAPSTTGDRDSRPPAFPALRRLRDPRHDHHARELRRRALRRHVAPEFVEVVQHHVRRARLPARRRRSPPAMEQFGIDERAPDRPLPGRGRQRRAAPGRSAATSPASPSPASARATCDRTPPDGARRRRHRQRRRDHEHRTW